MPWISVLTDDHTGMLDRPVGEEKLAAHYRGLGVFISMCCESVEPSLLRDRVVVQEDEILTARQGRAFVACDGKPAGRAARDDTNGVAVPLEDLGRRVGGSVIDHHDLEVHLRRPLEDCVYAPAG